MPKWLIFNDLTDFDSIRTKPLKLPKMKRRTFLTTSSTVGIVGMVSGASVVSSTYNSISASLLLEEFPGYTRSILDNFSAEVKLNIQAHGLDERLTDHLVMPVRIIDKNSKGAQHSITYKNASGQRISLSMEKGEEIIRIH